MCKSVLLSLCAIVLLSSYAEGATPSRTKTRTHSPSAPAASKSSTATSSTSFSATPAATISLSATVSPSTNPSTTESTSVSSSFTPTVSPTASPTISASYAPGSSEWSPSGSGTIGVAVGVSLGVAAIVAVSAFLLIRKRKQSAVPASLKKTVEKQPLVDDGASSVVGSTSGHAPLIVVSQPTPTLPQQFVSTTPALPPPSLLGPQPAQAMFSAPGVSGQSSAQQMLVPVTPALTSGNGPFVSFAANPAAVSDPHAALLPLDGNGQVQQLQILAPDVVAPPAVGKSHRKHRKTSVRRGRESEGGDGDALALLLKDRKKGSSSKSKPRKASSPSDGEDTVAEVQREIDEAKREARKDKIRRLLIAKEMVQEQLDGGAGNDMMSVEALSQRLSRAHSPRTMSPRSLSPRSLSPRRAVSPHEVMQYMMQQKRASSPRGSPSLRSSPRGRSPSPRSLRLPVDRTAGPAVPLDYFSVPMIPQAGMMAQPGMYNPWLAQMQMAQMMAQESAFSSPMAPFMTASQEPLRKNYSWYM